jgi:putative addiction module component (TIGR02574 family)
MDAAIKNLSIEEKINLVEELWEEIDKERTMGLSIKQREFLDERKRIHHENPNEGISIQQFIEKHLPR